MNDRVENETYALREYAEAMHNVQCMRGKKCTWHKEIDEFRESHTAGIWLYGQEHTQWFRVAAAQVKAINVSLWRH
jgi:hypothetical protein